LLHQSAHDHQFDRHDVYFGDDVDRRRGGCSAFRVNGIAAWRAAVTIPMLLGLYGFGFMFAAIVMVMRDSQTP